MRLGGLAALGFSPVVDLVELDAVDLLALDQLGLARFVDFDLLQHLANDHFDVLVVDIDALEAIDLLDLVDQVSGQILDALDREDVVGRRIALHDELTLFDHVAILQMDVLALGDEIFDRLDPFLVGLDGEPPLVLVVAAEAHGSGDFGDDRRLLGPARLEQLGHPRQAAGDVARLGAFGRNAGDDVAGLDLHAGIDRDHRIDRELVASLAAASEFQDLAVLALDDDGGTQILAAAGGAPIDDHALGNAGRFIERLRHRLALDQVLEPHRALDFGQDRTRVGIPFGQALAALDLVAVFDPQPRSVLDAVHRALGAVLVDHRHGHVAAHRDQLAVGVAGHVLVLDLDLALEIRFDEGLLRDLRRAADVEGAHRELGSRLADGLRGDDADRFAEIDRRAASEIAAVALAAHAVHHLASEHRTDADLLYACLADGLDLRLFDQGAALDQHGIAGRILDVLRGGAPEDAAAERSHHLAGIDDGPHLDARLGLAVLPGDDAVLGDVDQPPGQIPGVGGLERGVRQAFARAVGGVEILQDREALLEIGDDRALDDLARRLGHQAAHSGELLHLHQRAGILDDFPFRGRHHHVVLAEGNAGLEREMEAQRHDAVAEDDRLLLPAVAIDDVDHVGDLALRHQPVDDVERDLRIARQHLAQQRAARRGLVPGPHVVALLVHSGPAVPDLAVQTDDLLLERMLDLGDFAEHLILARLAFAQQRQIIQPQDDVLARHDDRRAVGGVQDVVGRHHQHARFELRLERQRHVHGHLVAVEIGVERRANQRMQLDRLALDQHRLERLDAEAVERRGAIEQHRML